MNEQEKRENVIKGLECCTKKVCIYKDTEKECPYWELCGEYEDSFEDCTTAMSKDALALLKAQEPMEPHYTRLEYKVNGMPYVVHHPECPRCIENGLMLWDAEIEKGAAYCKRCGQAVKWE